MSNETGALTGWVSLSSEDKAIVGIRLAICVIGLLGNLTVIFVVAVLREYKKNNTHWYVLQLAIADSIFLLTLPFKVDEQIHDQWRFSSGMCKGKETILFLNYYASILFLVIMSVDRYVAVCHGFSSIFQKMRRLSFAFIITGVIWTVAILICIPVMLYSDKRGDHPTCKCSYVFPKPVKSPEEFCRSEGYTGDNMQECLDVQNSFLPADDSPCKGEITLFSSFPESTGSSFHEMSGNGSEMFPSPSTFNFSDYFGPPDLLSQSGDLSGDGESEISILDLLSSPNGLDYILQLLDSQPPPATNNTGIAPACHYFLSGNLWRGFLIFNFVGMFIVPLMIMTFCYCMIIYTLQTTKIPIADRHHHVANGNSKGKKSGQQASHERREKVRNRVTVMCALLVLLFVVCWLPFHSVHMAKLKGINTQNTRLCVILPIVVSICAYVNSALNPFLYNFFSTGFLKRLRKAGYELKLRVRKSIGTQSIKEIDKQAMKNYKKSRSRGTTASNQNSPATRQLLPHDVAFQLTAL